MPASSNRIVEEERRILYISKQCWSHIWAKHQTMKSATGRKLEAIWKHSADALVLADMLSQKIVDANPSAAILFGYSVEEFRTLHVADLHPTDRLQEVMVAFLQAANSPGKFVDLEIVRADGARVPVEISTGTFVGDDGQLVGIGSFRDTSERVRANNGVRRLNWALSAVNRASQAIVTAESEADMMRLLCEGITGDAFTIAWIGLIQDGQGEPVVVAARAGRELGYLDGLFVSWGDNPDGRGPTGLAIRETRTQINNEPHSNQAFAPWSERARAHNIHSSMATPIVRNGEVIGALTVYSDQASAFGPEVVRLFEDLARELVVGLESRRHRAAYDAEVLANIEHIAHYKSSLEQMVAALAATIEKRDPYTAGHQKRVCDLALGVARRLGWDENRCQSVYLSGLVHDIGKINVPSEILNKPGKLLSIEFELVKLHPATGYEILKGIDFPWPLADITRQHHERIDGSGYPDGLIGDAILPEAQVIAVADVFEAISSHRPYRPALGHEAAIIELRRLRGNLIKAEIVDAAIDVFSDQCGLW